MPHQRSTLATCSLLRRLATSRAERTWCIIHMNAVPVSQQHSIIRGWPQRTPLIWLIRVLLHSSIYLVVNCACCTTVVIQLWVGVEIMQAVLAPAPPTIITAAVRRHTSSNARSRVHWLSRPSARSKVRASTIMVVYCRYRQPSPTSIITTNSLSSTKRPSASLKISFKTNSSTIITCSSSSKRSSIQFSHHS